MKQLYIRLGLILVCISGTLVSCKRESPNIFNMFNVTLDLQYDKTKSADDVIELSGTDSVSIKYTLECPTEDIYGVALFKAGTSGGIITNITPARRATGTYKIYAKDLGVGETTYRIWAVNRATVYLGDGYKKIRIRIKPEFHYITNRIVYVGDTAGTRESYLALSDGKTYSYLNGATESANIDLGIYSRRIDTLDKTNFGKDTTIAFYPLYLYSLSANPNPNNVHNISTWTKKGTLFSPMEDGNEDKLRNTFNTAAKIIAEAQKKTYGSVIRSGYDKGDRGNTYTAFSGKFVFYKTPDGKYGVILFNVAKKDEFNRVYTSLSWKSEM